MGRLRYVRADITLTDQQMPIPRYGHEAVCVLDRYLLCIGGKAVGGRDTPQFCDEVVGASTDVLDTVTGKWAQLPCKLGCPRVYFGAVAVGSSVIVCGGMALGGARQGTSEGRLDSTEILDAASLPLLFSSMEDESSPLVMSWRYGPWLQFPRYDFSLAGPISGRLFAVGGSGARRLVEELDVSALSSSPALLRTRDPQAREALLADGWIDVHAHAGYPPERSPQTEGQNASRWVLHPVELPSARSSGNAVAVGNRLILCCGSERSVLSYEPDAAAWVGLGVELDSMRLGAKAVAFHEPRTMVG